MISKNQKKLDKLEHLEQARWLFSAIMSHPLVSQSSKDKITKKYLDTEDLEVQTMEDLNGLIQNGIDRGDGYSTIQIWWTDLLSRMVRGRAL